VKAKLAVAATMVACCGALAASTPAASAAKPLLCEHSCGGSWGAYEHAKAFAEQHGFWDVFVEKCWKSSEYGAQWHCVGGGLWGGSNNNWGVWMDAYGYEKHWVQTYI
jgi:hypothetical protein